MTPKPICGCVHLASLGRPRRVAIFFFRTNVGNYLPTFVLEKITPPHTGVAPGKLNERTPCEKALLLSWWNLRSKAVRQLNCDEPKIAVWTHFLKPSETVHKWFNNKHILSVLWSCKRSLDFCWLIVPKSVRRVGSKYQEPSVGVEYKSKGLRVWVQLLAFPVHERLVTSHRFISTS